MHPYRTRFKKDIVAEFLPPLTRRRPKTDRVIIFCVGMPSGPSRGAVMDFWAKKGYWTFLPRYRGSWESGGRFLKRSPERDVLDVIGGLPKGFTSFSDGKRYRVRPSEIYLFASSFGGPAGILASRDRRVTKVVALSPVVEWRAPSKAEPLDWLYGFVKNAFGEGYRMSRADWNKLKTGRFYNPMAHVDEIDGRKLLIFHARDDESVGWRPVAKFAKFTGAKLVLLRRGGHLSSSNFMKPSFYRRIAKFLKAK